MLLMGITGHDKPDHNLGSRKQNQNEIEDDININEPQKTCGMHANHQHLHDPFPEEDNDDGTLLSTEEVYAIIAGDELTSLKEAQNSPEWPEWQQAMAKELELLKQMGTWKLVPKPPNTIPIANKWVFIKKHNNNREEIRKRAWLVAKGCMQCPRYDYLEIYSPVVRMDTLCTILALVPLKNL